MRETSEVTGESVTPHSRSELVFLGNDQIVSENEVVSWELGCMDPIVKLSTTTNRYDIAHVNFSKIICLFAMEYECTFFKM